MDMVFKSCLVTLINKRIKDPEHYGITYGGKFYLSVDEIKEVLDEGSESNISIDSLFLDAMLTSLWYNMDKAFCSKCLVIKADKITDELRESLKKAMEEYDGQIQVY